MKVELENPFGARLSFIREDQWIGRIRKHAAADRDVVVQKRGECGRHSDRVPVTLEPETPSRLQPQDGTVRETQVVGVGGIVRTGKLKSDGRLGPNVSA